MSPIPVGAGLPAMADYWSAETLLLYSVPVGESLLAKAARQPTGILCMYHLQKIAASLHSTAPTGECACIRTRPACRPPRAPLWCTPPREASGGSAQWATRHGCRVSRVGPWMARRGGPRSRTGRRVCRAIARHRTLGARALGYLALFQVTRRKGGTISGRYRSNGYALNLKTALRTQDSGGVGDPLGCLCEARHAAGGMPNWLMNQRVNELAME